MGLQDDCGLMIQRSTKETLRRKGRILGVACSLVSFLGAQEYGKMCIF